MVGYTGLDWTTLHLPVTTLEDHSTHSDSGYEQESLDTTTPQHDTETEHHHLQVIHDEIIDSLDSFFTFTISAPPLRFILLPA